MSLPNFISLGGVELTDQGRTFASARDERSTPVQLASGLTKKYFMGNIKNTFSLSWTWLPGSSALTFDTKGGRDSIKTLADLKSVLALVVRTPVGSSATYNVWVESYSETILRRDFRANTIWYEVQMELKEQ